MSIHQIIKEHNVKDPIILGFIKSLKNGDYRKFYQDAGSISYLIDRILPNIAAEFNCLDALKFLLHFRSNMSYEVLCLPTSLEERMRTGLAIKDVVIRSPIFWACYHKNLKMLQFLIDSKVNLFHKSKWTKKNNPLFIAIEKGFLEGVILLLTNRFRYRKISDGSILGFHEILKDATLFCFEREYRMPFQLDTIQILELLLRYPQNNYMSYLKKKQLKFLRYIRKRFFVYFRHYAIRSYSRFLQLKSSIRVEIDGKLWNSVMSKRDTLFLSQFSKSLSKSVLLLYEILWNEDLTNVIASYISYI